MRETVLEGKIGDHNYFNVDVSTDIDAGDLVTFKAGRTHGDLSLIVKNRPVGVVDVTPADGIVQVQLQPADTSALTDEALLFEVVLRKADVGNVDTTVVKGVLRLTK